jgi:DNA modification methylase/transcriptional regulator with XRE-family HTH domain
MKLACNSLNDNGARAGKAGLTPVIIGDATLYRGDCLAVMRTMADNSVDSIVTDPPYELTSARPGGRSPATEGKVMKGFMGMAWDGSGIAYDVDMWREALRVLKPGGHLLAFSGSRTYHRMTCAIEDAGFEIRDQIMWLYGSGFPKSRNIGKDIDYRGGAQLSWFGPWLREWREKRGISQSEMAKHFPSKSGGKTGRVSNFELGTRLPTADDFNLICKVLDLPFASIEEVERDVIGKKPGDPERFRSFAEQDGNERRTFNNDITAPATDAARQWDGWGTALKPAHEPICVARKPLIGTVAANVLAHGTGAFNIDGCRVPTNGEAPKGTGGRDSWREMEGRTDRQPHGGNITPDAGRWPANIIHDGSDEVVALFPHTASGTLTPEMDIKASSGWSGGSQADRVKSTFTANTGSAARFFYCAKASRPDRNEGCEALPQKVGDMVSNTSGQHMTRRDEDYEAKPLGNHHPTVKPTDLMAYLVRLVTPPGGLVLDPFMGSGSTGKAAMRDGFQFVGIDMTAEYVEIARARISFELARVASAAAEAKATAELAARQSDMFAEAP